MPAKFFTATDDKPTGTANAYKRLATFMRTNQIPLSTGIPALGRDAIHDAIGEIWDGIGGDLPTIKTSVTGAINAELSELEVAMIVFFCLSEKFQQFGTTLPGGGGP